MRSPRWGWVSLVVVVAIGVGVIATLSEPAPHVQAQNGSITLVARWNLVAAPRDGTPEEVVGALADVRSLHRWDAEARQFESWLRTAPIFVNSLASLSAGDGLWVEVTGQVTWDLPPLATVVAQPATMGLRLIGWTAAETPASAAAVQLAAEQVTGWNAAAQSFALFDVGLPEPLNSLATLERGMAYWVAFGSAGPTTFDPVDLEVFATESNPVDLGPLPRDEIFIVSKNGLVRRYDL